VFNLDKTFFTKKKYLESSNFWFKNFISGFGILPFLEGIRNQISEIQLIQLIPGFYYFLLLLIFFYLIWQSSTIFVPIYKKDKKKLIGIKLIIKLKFNLIKRFSYFLLLTIFLIILISILPISLDCFNNTSEEEIFSSWTFSEVLNLEILFLLLLLFLSQTPLEFSKCLHYEVKSSYITQAWRKTFFFLVLFSGSLTPTIDGNTQLNFASCASSLFLIYADLNQKKDIHLEKEFYGN
jgi:hypothetical protein